MEWWQTLTVFEQGLFVLSLGSFIILLAKLFVTIFQWYKIDKLSVEREDVEKYDQIANDDSDVEKEVPKYFSLVSVNLFLFVLGTSRILFKLFLNGFWLLFLNYFVASFVFVVYSFMQRRK